MPVIADYAPLLAEWDTELNRELVPGATSATWRRDVWWRCSRNASHGTWRDGIRKRWKWFADGAKLTERAGCCPQCWQPPRSKVERWLETELAKRFVLEDTRTRIQTEKGWETVDMVVRGQGKGIVVEYDGAYSHKCRAGCRHNRPGCKRDNDAKKAARLRKAGFHVVRVRERPLDAGCAGQRRMRHWLHVVPPGSAASKAALLEAVVAELGGFRAVARRRSRIGRSSG